LKSGVYESRDYQSSSVTSTPKAGLSKEASKHDITTISEETVEELETGKRLPNWYERSPRKRSVASIPSLDVSYFAFNRSSQGSASIKRGVNRNSVRHLMNTAKCFCNALNRNLPNQLCVDESRVFVKGVYRMLEESRQV